MYTKTIMLPILAGILGTFFTIIWVSVPELQPWGLQATAAFFLLYFASTRFAEKQTLRFLPPRDTLHSIFLTAGAGILVGSTGGTQSPFLLVLPVTVFFCTLTLPLGAVLTQTLGLSLILWITHSGHWSQLDVTKFLLLPLLLPMIILARLEIDQSRHSRHAEFLANEKLQKQAQDALLFLTTVVGPKIQTIQLFLQQSSENREQANQQLEILRQDIRAFSHDLEEHG